MTVGFFFQAEEESAKMKIRRKTQMSDAGKEPAPEKPYITTVLVQRCPPASEQEGKAEDGSGQ